MAQINISIVIPTSSTWVPFYASYYHSPTENQDSARKAGQYKLHFKILKIYPRVILSIIKSRWANKVVKMLDKRKRSNWDFSELFRYLNVCGWEYIILILWKSFGGISSLNPQLSKSDKNIANNFSLYEKLVKSMFYLLQLHKKISWNVTSI